MTIGALAAGICATSAGIHGLSVALASRRCRQRSLPPMAPPKDAPSVTIVQPLCGVETFSRETLRSIFALDYPSYEIIFCLASGDDPIAPLVRGAIEANPGHAARLLIGDHRISANPSQQCRQGVEGGALRLGDHRRFQRRMPGDYLSVCWRAGAPDSGIVCAPPIGSRPSPSPPRSSAPFSTPMRRAGSMRANPPAMALPRARRCRRAGDAGKGRGHRGFGGGDRRRRRGDQAHQRAGTERPPRRRTLPAAARPPAPAGRLVAELRWARLRRVTFPLFSCPDFHDQPLHPGGGRRRRACSG